MKWIVFILLFTVISCSHYSFSDNNIIESNCSRTCILGKDHWASNGVKEWPRECHTIYGEKFDPVFMKFNDGVRWTNMFYSNTDDFRKYFISSVLDICNGACFDRILIKSVTHFFNKYKVTNVINSNESKMINIIKDYSSGLSLTQKCKECRLNDCRITPLLQSSRQYFDKSIVFWGVSSSEPSNVLFVKRGLDSEISNIMSGEDKQKQPHFFPPGYTKDYHISIFDNITTHYWKLGSKRSTFLQLQNEDDDIERYGKDCNNNDISDICEMLYDKNNCMDLQIPTSCLLGRDKTKEKFCKEIKTSDLSVCNPKLKNLAFFDCNLNGIDDEIDIFFSPGIDTDEDGVIDQCTKMGACIVSKLECIDEVNIFSCNGDFKELASCKWFWTPEPTKEPPPPPSSTEPTRHQTTPYTHPSTETKPSIDTHPSVETHPSTHPSTHTTIPITTSPEPTLDPQNTFGSCYMSKNVIKCNDYLSMEHCNYLQGVFSDLSCDERDDMIETITGKIGKVQHIDVSGPNDNLSTQELIIVISVPVYISIVLLVSALLYYFL